MKIRLNKKQEICLTNCKSKSKIEKAKKIIENDGDIIEISEKLKLLGNSTRLKIIFALKYGELCVCEISEIIELSIPATSQQLKMLRQANILKSRSEGKTIYYSLTNTKIPEMIKKIIKSMFA